MENEDKKIVEMILAGDTSLFEDIIKKYEKSVVGFIYKMVFDYEDALELAQETFMKVFSSLKMYDPSYKFSTWLFTIARNKAIDFLRGGKYKNSYDDRLKIKSNGQNMPFSTDLKSPEDNFFVRDNYEKLLLIIEELPVEYREVITLRYMNNLSYGEIAKITNLPLGTVKNRLFRAKILIRENFERKFGKI